MPSVSGTTQANYVESLTLGPDEFEGIQVAVWNATAVGRFYDLGPTGRTGSGTWGEEAKYAPGTIQARRTGGAQFRTNPDTPSTPALVIMSGWKAGQSVIAGGVQLTGQLSAAGGFVPVGGASVIGRVSLTGTVLSGTGFAVAHPATGHYVVTFAVALAAIPAVFPAIAGPGSTSCVAATATNVATTGFDVFTYNASFVQTDGDWNFQAILP